LECCVRALDAATEAPALESCDLGQQHGDGLVAPASTVTCVPVTLQSTT
jgi:hypothetical protein